MDTFDVRELRWCHYSDANENIYRAAKLPDDEKGWLRAVMWFMKGDQIEFTASEQVLFIEIVTGTGIMKLGKHTINYHQSRFEYIPIGFTLQFPVIVSETLLVLRKPPPLNLVT